MSKEQRVFAHYKAMKFRSPMKFVVIERIDGLTPGGILRGYNTPSTSNEVWLHLARVHKMKVREVKDIVTRMRKERRETLV